MTFAIARLNRHRPGRGADVEDALRQLQDAHEKQEGYLGTLVVDLDDERKLVVNLWRSPEDAQRALPAMLPVVTRALEPTLAEPSQLVGAGSATYRGAPLAPQE